MNVKFSGPMKYVNKTAALLISLLLLITMTFVSLPEAHAGGGVGDVQVTEAPVQTDSPQPTDTTPQPTDSVQPTQAPGTTDSTGQAEYVGTMSDGQKIIKVNGKECLEGEVIVKFKDSEDASSTLRAFASTESAEDKDTSGGDLVVASVPQGETVGSFINEMEDMPNVEYAQPNYVYKIDKTVNDPYANSKGQWYLDTIDAYDAWDITMGSSTIKVADLDTGVDLSNSEFSGKIYAQWDFVNNDGKADDDNGHGTFTAGIITANANNNTGIAGIASGVKLIAAKVLDADGYGNTSDIVDAINYAVNQGARVINMSFGGDGKDPAEEEAINNAVEAGVVCVAAAGNDGSADGYVSPSDDEACISVIATEKDNKKADYSNYGPYKDISAPGSNILSTMKGGGYGIGSGTSFAAPMVTATAALILSVNPDLSVNQVKDILYSTATNIGNSYYFGHGLLDAYKAVQRVLAPSVTAASEGYNSVKVTWNTVDGVSGYEVWRSTKSTGSYSLVSKLNDTSYTDSGLNAGTTYYYRVRAYYTDDSGTVYGKLSSYVYARPLPAAPSSVDAEPATYNSIKISWSAAEGATGYKVYRSASSGGSYSLVRTTTGLSVTDTGVKTGSTYFYKICSYTGSTKAYGGFSGEASAATFLADISWANAFSYSPSSITLTWGSVTGTSKYEIWRHDSLNGTDSCIKTTASVSYKDTGRIPGITYYYKIRPYRVVSGKKVYGNYTSEISSTPELKNVSGVSAAMYSSTSNKIYWDSVPGCSGYEVVSCDPAGGSEKHLKFTKYKYAYDTGLVPNQTYYYKVRAYIIVGGKNYYSGFSAVLSAEPVF